MKPTNEITLHTDLSKRMQIELWMCVFLCVCGGGGRVLSTLWEPNVPTRIQKPESSVCPKAFHSNNATQRAASLRKKQEVKNKRI